MFEQGSFNWYKEIDDKFFKHLTRSIMHADGTNIKALRKIFPHICEAHKAESWDEAPKVDGPVTMNVEERFLEEKDKCCETNQGSFSHYLHRSGDFVTHFSHAIAYADKHNRKLIELEYPQMVASYDMPLWNICPYGFEWNAYNSPRKVFENTSFYS